MSVLSLPRLASQSRSRPARVAASARDPRSSVTPHLPRGLVRPTPRQWPYAASVPSCDPSTGIQSSRREELEVEYGDLRARMIKQKLDELGADSSSCFDKESLLNKLVDTLLSIEPQGVSAGEAWLKVPLIWKKAASMFAGIQTQQGEYAGIQLEFPALQNGQAPPQDFIIDTASSVNIILPEVASRLNAPTTGTTGSGIGGTGQLAGSYEVAMGPANAQGQAFWKDVRTVVMNLPTAPGTAGILGLSFLNECGALAFNWGTRPGNAVFYSKEGTGWTEVTKDLEKVSLIPIQNGLPCVWVTINGVRMLALVDTGAAFSCANKAAGIPVDPNIEPMWVSGADGNPMQMGISAGGVTARLEESSVELTDITMLVGDLPAFSLLGLSPGTPGLILGLDALVQRPNVVISTSSYCMWL